MLQSLGLISVRQLNDHTEGEGAWLLWPEPGKLVNQRNPLFFLPNYLFNNLVFRSLNPEQLISTENTKPTGFLL